MAVKNFLTINVKYRHFPERFWRTVKVDDKINLEKFGCVLCTALSAEFEHAFLFRSSDNRTTYMPTEWVGDCVKGNNKRLDKTKVRDLGDKFSFEYDTGDGWDFVCEVISNEEISTTEYAYLIDGKGQGIWEDNRYTLDAYLSGEISGSCKKVNEKKGYAFPWNFDIEKIGDFDNGFNLKEEEILFNYSYKNNYHNYKHPELLDFDDYSDNNAIDEEVLDELENLYKINADLIDASLYTAVEQGSPDIFIQGAMLLILNNLRAFDLRLDDIMESKLKDSNDVSASLDQIFDISKILAKYINEAYKDNTDFNFDRFINEIKKLK